MNNTNRDHTEEGRDRDGTDATVVPPPQKPAADASAHVPGDATEMAELNRSLQEETTRKGAKRASTPPAGEKSPTP